MGFTRGKWVVRNRQQNQACFSSPGGKERRRGLRRAVVDSGRCKSPADGPDSREKVESMMIPKGGFEQLGERWYYLLIWGKTGKK